MAVRRHKSRGTWVWQARVSYQGRRRSVYRATKNEAKDAAVQLLQTLKAERDQATRVEQAPATLRMLLEHHVADLEARGKGVNTVIRATSNAKMIERVTPALLDVPVSTIGDAEIFAFRNARAREGKVVFETVAGKRQPSSISASWCTGVPTLSLPDVAIAGGNLALDR